LTEHVRSWTNASHLPSLAVVVDLITDL
jgi:hypothetical protein